MKNKENFKGQPIDFGTLSNMPEFKSEPEPESELEFKSKQNSINALVELGYGADSAREMTLAKGISRLKDSTLADNINKNFTFLQELGYSQDDVIKMTKSLPAIYSLSIDNMKQKILDMQELGYSQDDVIKMTKSLPAIYGLSIDNMKQKILD
ncbi:MAG: hypothetical protein Q4A36_03920, partial [Candidatus Saccharibacteria bacterium]|nr:hypothetical protein [Candidatus Saccharibacteria bacterium]